MQSLNERAMSHALIECMAHSMRLFRIHQTCEDDGCKPDYSASLFSQGWLATPQLVLHALWQEVWHSPQPPLTALLAISRVFNVTICFMIMSFLKMKLSNCALCRVRLESKTDLLSQCRCIRVKPALTLPYYMDYTHKSQRL